MVEKYKPITSESTLLPENNERITNKNVSDSLEQEKLNQQVQLRELKGKYARQTFWFIYIWSGFVALLLGVNGLAMGQISDGVMITLLSTTFIEILGLAIIVMRHLFPTNSSE